MPKYALESWPSHPLFRVLPPGNTLDACRIWRLRERCLPATCRLLKSHTQGDL